MRMEEAPGGCRGGHAAGGAVAGCLPPRRAALGQLQQVQAEEAETDECVAETVHADVHEEVEEGTDHGAWSEKEQLGNGRTSCRPWGRRSRQPALRARGRDLHSGTTHAGSHEGHLYHNTPVQVNIKHGSEMWTR